MPTETTSHTESRNALIEVAPARLAHGQWCPKTERALNEGDITQSYSADIIPNGRVRRPFEHGFELYVSVGNSLDIRRRESAKAYRLALRENFNGKPTTYSDVRMNAEAARQSPLGFYHGIAVVRGKAQYVLCGPPVVFVEAENQPTETQLDLF